MITDLDVPTRSVVLKALADPLRLEIIDLLRREELCGCHFVEELGVAQPLVSHHLKVLREAGLVTTSRVRYWTYYRLEAEPLERLSDLFRAVATDASGPDARRPCC